MLENTATLFDEVPSLTVMMKFHQGWTLLRRGMEVLSQQSKWKMWNKILLVLFAIGPLFVLETPTSFFVTSVFAIHVEDTSPFYTNQSCSAKFIFLEKGIITSLASLVLLPLFMWIVFSLLQRRLLSIFSRLCFAALIYLLGAASMFCIDLAGHIVSDNNTPNDISMCMFIIHHHNFELTVLKLPWAVLLVPCLLLALGPPLTVATVVSNLWTYHQW